MARKKKKIKKYQDGGPFEVTEPFEDVSHLIPGSETLAEERAEKIGTQMGTEIAKRKKVRREKTIKGIEKTSPYAGIGLESLGEIVATQATKSEIRRERELGATAGGALKGAGIGAQLGSIVPGVGTAIGAGAGAIIGGGLGFEQSQRMEHERTATERRKQIALAKLREQFGRSEYARAESVEGGTGAGITRTFHEGGTVLSSEEEKKFQEWIKKWEIKNPDNPLHFYDYRGAFKSGVIPTRWEDLPKEDKEEDSIQVAEGKRPHIPPNAYMWPDEFKLKGHPIPAKKKGGQIKGLGTGTSDSIKTRLEDGSFIVPARNAGIAQKIRSKYLGDKQNREAAIPRFRKGGLVAKVSNGEHLFTPEEVKVLKGKNVNLNALAPDAEVKIPERKHGGLSGTNDFQTQLFIDSFQLTKEKALENATRKAIDMERETEERFGFSPKFEKTLQQGGLVGKFGIPEALGSFQTITGLGALSRLGRPPEYTMEELPLSADLTREYAEAKKEAKYGLSPTARAEAERKLESLRRGQVENIVNLAGGLSGTALANIAAAGTRAGTQRLQLEQMNEQVKQKKQELSRALARDIDSRLLHRFETREQKRRRMFEDKLREFDTARRAYAGLTQAGISNVIGGLQMQRYLETARDKEEKKEQPFKVDELVNLLKGIQSDQVGVGQTPTYSPTIPFAPIDGADVGTPTFEQ